MMPADSGRLAFVADNGPLSCDCQRYGVDSEMKSNTKKLLACLGVGLMLQGCDTTSDLMEAADPTDWFSEDEATQTTETEKPVPNEDEDYPNVGAVPERPEEPEIKREYDKLKSTLVADKENARYTDRVLRSAEEVENPLETDGAPVKPMPKTLSEPPVAEAVKSAPKTYEKPAPTPEKAEPVQPAPKQVAAKPAPAAEPMVPEVAPVRAEQPPQNAKPLAKAPENDLSQSRQAQATVAQVADPVTKPQDQGEPDKADAKHIANIYFADGVSSLNKHDRQIVEKVAALFRDGGKSVRVIGHSSAASGAKDAVKAGLVNYKVSLDRASAVATALVQSGVPKAAIQVDARGASQPLYEENTREAQAYNRRAEVFILY